MLINGHDFQGHNIQAKNKLFDSIGVTDVDYLSWQGV